MDSMYGTSSSQTCDLSFLASRDLQTKLFGTNTTMLITNMNIIPTVKISRKGKPTRRAEDYLEYKLHYYCCLLTSNLISLISVSFYTVYNKNQPFEKKGLCVDGFYLCEYISELVGFFLTLNYGK